VLVSGSLLESQNQITQGSLRSFSKPAPTAVTGKLSCEPSMFDEN